MISCPACGEENPPKFRLCGYCGAPLAAAPSTAPLPVREMRKTVTLIFSDVKDAAALGERLDSEVLHEIKARYLPAMAAEIERHGGRVEKYVGLSIIAAFGLPRAHEDDALRAVRAAVDMRAALGHVNDALASRHGVELAVRIGVNTGVVVVSDDPQAAQRIAIGETMALAESLQQAAPAGEIYLGEPTFGLVRDAVDVQVVDSLALAAPADKVPAYRLVSIRGLDGYARRVDTPLVGRDEELAALDDAYRQACQRRAAWLVTLIGDAGLGKSRLASEAAERIAADAYVLRGRCLPYGDGITFWPLVGIVRQAADIGDDDHPEAARAKLLAVVGDADVAQRLASAVGLNTTAFPLHEIYWGARRFLEGLAARGPVMVLIDDIHWAEPALLDLLDHVLDTSHDAPILLLATARHELLDRKPDWGERERSARIVLRPLTEGAAGQVAANLLGPTGLPLDVARRIISAAEGNPLYVEQMLAMLIDKQVLRFEHGRWVHGENMAGISVPPTIQALLEARLDSLPRADRATADPASVVGLEFPRDAVEALAPEALRPNIGEHLDALVRKRFVRPATLERGETIYRFDHQLLRDTVYNALLKRTRASMHIAFVGWADRVNAERERGLEFQEILGYHLEQAHRCLSDLGPLDEAGVAIGVDAARRLSAAGKRAMARGDRRGAANLLQRAVSLLDADHAERAELLLALADALMDTGDFAAARAALEEARALADRMRNPRIKALGQLIDLNLQLSKRAQGDWSKRALDATRELIPVLEREDAHNELAIAWRLNALVHGVAGRYSLASKAATQSNRYAHLAGNDQLAQANRMNLAQLALYGSTPVDEAIAECEALIGEGFSDRISECAILCVLAQLRAMNGALDLARALYRRSRGMLRDLGQGVPAAACALDCILVELHGGDLAAAELEARADYAFLERVGETYYRSTMAGLLARLIRDQGRDSEAMRYLAISEEASAADDIESQALWRMVRAPIEARAGHLDLAEALAREAVTLTRSTEGPGTQANALSELASVLRIAGKGDDAREVMEQAIALYAAKGNVVAVSRSRLWLAQSGEA